MNWKQFFKPILVVAAVAACGGAIVVGLGLVPVRASDGHFAITRWFLEFSLARSIDTYSSGIEVPDNLDDPARILRGAGHFQTGCYHCHGNPTTPHPRVARAMLPQPPYLPNVLDQWEPEELFSIVRHGIKFAGMPAWPADHRDDEVWDVVAFLNQFPTLDEEGYQKLVYGEAKDTRPSLAAANIARATVEQCTRCHGTDGLGRGDATFPVLATQTGDYLFQSLQDYATGRRPSGMMEPIAAELTDSEMRALANHFAGRTGSQSPRGGESAGKPSDRKRPGSGDDTLGELVERGRLLAVQGDKAAKIPSCVDCHGPTTQDRNPAYPVLAGHPASYLETQLRLFASHDRAGSSSSELMHPIAEKLDGDQQRALAAYFHQLPLAGINPRSATHNE